MFRYAVSGPLGAASGNAYNRQTYGAIQLGGWATEFFDAQADGDPFFLYIAPHSPHEDEGGGYGSAIEKLYAGAVDPATVAPGGSLAATYAEQIAVGYVANSTQRTTYEDRQELMASIDDMLTTIVGYLTARWGDDWTIIFTTDQGIQNGEQSAWGNGAIKTAIWEGSTCSMLIMRGPKFTAGATVDRMTVHADIPLTILDLFGLTDHHAHQDRDGRSLLRVTDPSDVAYGRCIPLFGDYKSGQGSGFIKEDGRKYILLNGVHSSAKWWSPMVDYEAAQTAPTTTELSVNGPRFDAIAAARWNPSTNTNPANNGTI